MASSVAKDTLIVLKKRLERAEDDKTILHLIHKLSKFPVTLDILQGTGAGKIMRSLAKRSGEVGIKASSVLNKWREVVAESQKSNEHVKKSKHSRSNYDSLNKISPDIHKLSEKYAKEKHDKVKHSKEKHLKSGHKEHIDLFKINGNMEKESKKYLKETSKYKHSDHSIEKTSKYNPYLEYESLSQESYMSGSYNPDHPEIFPQMKSLSKHEDSKLMAYNVTYEPSPKKPKLQKSYSPEYESKNKKQMGDSCLLSSDSTLTKVHSQDDFYKRKTPKSSKVDIEKNGHLTEKASKIPDNIKKIKKNKDSSESMSKKTTKKIVIQNAEEFTASEALFEDCLSFNDILPVNKRKSSGNKKVKINKNDNLHKVKNVTPLVPPKSSLESNNVYSANKSEKLMQIPSANNKEMDIVFKSLPQPLPNYRPLPQRSCEAASIMKKKAMSNEEAIKFTSSRREKTAVYSGRKNNYLTEVPSLFECCTRVLIENIDDIEYMGEIPFFLLESMLRRCTPVQLYRLEHFNPYLLEDTNELWEVHCKRDYRSSRPQENETWRELYWRSHEEQEERFKNVTASISASIANSNPVRKAKLAYIDAVVKPPREVARRQAKNGTALPTNHSVKAASPTKSIPKSVVAAVKAASTSRGPAEYKPQKPKVAPLMAKTLKSMRQCFRR